MGSMGVYGGRFQAAAGRIAGGLRLRVDKRLSEFVRFRFWMGTRQRTTKQILKYQRQTSREGLEMTPTDPYRPHPI
jgi:hypothetical protein